MPTRIVVADDHPVMIDGIASSGGLNFEIVGTAVVAADIIERVRTSFPDVLVMEVRLGGRDALKSLETIKAEFPDLPVIVFSSQENPSHIARSAALGCFDYIPKTSTGSKLVEAINNAAMRGETPCDSLLKTTRTKMRKGNVAGHDIPLTNRETQVLQHISMGLSNREVGKSLGISVETVKEHVQNILRKLDVNDRTQAAVWAVKRGLV